MKEIIIYTDFVCPYCLLLERRLHKIFSNEEVKVTWRAHELRPFPVPTLKIDDEYLPLVWSNSVYPLAEQIGIDIRLPRISPQPRTDKAFEAHLFATDNGVGEIFPIAVMVAFFQQERNIGDIDVLVDIGGEVGLDREALRRALEQGAYGQKHQQALQHAKEVEQIRVVPTIIIGDNRYEGLPSEHWLTQSFENQLVDAS
jgi:predicted DsbA family dithiol-disulfide isomerase